MPGRVRQEGIEYYEKGQLSLEKVDGQKLFLRIAGEDFYYHLDGQDLSCTCSLFSQKDYCQHLAATEYFLKNDSSVKEMIEQVQKESQKEEERERHNYFGGLFLDKILGSLEPKLVKYRLVAEGSLGAYDKQIDWTLKISRIPDQRSYVIRDIGAFLKILDHGGHYQIGKNYYEPLSFEEFDRASQDLIEFLWQLIPEKNLVASDVLVNFGRSLRLPLAYFEEGLELLQGLSSFQFSHGVSVYSNVFVLPYDANLGLFHFELKAHTHMLELLIKERPIQDLMQGRYLIIDNSLYYLNRQERALLASLKSLIVADDGLKKIQVDYQDQEKLALVLEDLQLLGKVIAPKKFRIHNFQAAFYLSKVDQLLYLETTLDFAGILVKSQEDLEELPFLPNYHHLQRIVATIENLGFRGKFHAQREVLQAKDLYQFFTDGLSNLRTLGVLTLAQEVEDLLVEDAPQISVSTSGSLLDISFDFSGIAVDEIQAATQALLNQEAYFTSKTGHLLVFDEETKKISQTLQFLRARHASGGHLTLNKLAGYQLAQTLENRHQVHLSTDFQELAHDLAHPESYPLSKLNLQADLRTYQTEGVKWLSMLDKYGFGGILADDMGLGKTLQTIAFLSQQIKKDSRVLILAPASLIYNWQEEFHRFAPQLDVAVVYGHKLERDAILAKDHQVLVTSYASFRQDIETYQANKHYDYLILDEAQVMKNSQTKIAQHLRDFEVGNCFALSGTPIENNLAEIWSIFQIVLPGLLPNRVDFSKLSASQVARIIKPFVLRRKKEDVLLELPDLIEVNVLNELTDSQKAIYLAQLQQMQASIVGASLAEINRRKIEILSGITRLRQICDTPKLFMDDYQGDSGKLDSLRDLLVQLKEGNHRVLIFSQFRDMLEIIESDLTRLGLSSYKLTGSTPAGQRQTMTRAFNAGSRDVFLISLKAGGVGLNLTGADTVILVDLWWNPAVEAQAISRAHRMGQTEKVEFYRLITRGTIEEKIQALQETKKNLVTAVLDGNESRASMTAQEIREILGIS
ncbi:SNF2 family DNA/RNA helicase [Streptococcus varani]|uniref:SNF2 family DNA/RNA helicase n=2 Tax=Streptococcus varani TaxID=1608583 RepID=A0A0E4H601_9STRE|nr:SNF2 family DNA/RNA helicase [Streptococcus varani]